MTMPPGATIGILGGGQLGRMLAMAAAQLGYRVHIYSPEGSGPATEVSAEWTQGRYDDGEALAAFADAVDVVTFEFENVPAEPLRRLAERAPVHPRPAALAVAQDRLAEKEFVARLGGTPAPFRAVDTLAALEQAVAAIGAPAILKTRRFGYDGKGQARIAAAGDCAAAWAAIGGAPAVLEGFVPFEREFSVLAVRGADGAFEAWDVPENRHVDGILAASTVPAGGRIAAQADAAATLARWIADELDYVGVLACEFFATDAGPVFNEMAPRVHNSGHWTIEGAVTSQFENHIRAICGLPLGATTLAAPAIEMRNLIGEQVNDWPTILADPAAHLHLYGKREARPGRKMGHVTWLGL
ncbi:5-(carboxyamino)imidazole ribonucleotide synthase [Sphingomonas profundi]|uniref:5-(carboxyamino)imidazole ribonucleotide synthase n=1 Tax=Alterirhizorhabdus profundi TaxID=2681549 RepID=UPI0012E6F469|nr:5-(carboxyamino)imidazole ribonucleotide synthase [Sphingomonas profundi]